MGRYIKEFPMNGTQEQMYGTLCKYLFTQGYEETVYKGEKLLKKPDTFTTGPIFFKVSFLLDNKMRIESWMKRALLPGGAYVGEIAPEEFQGWAVKGEWKRCISYIEECFNGQTVPKPTEMPQQKAESPSQQYASRFCTACGSPLKSGAAFCGNCGAKV